MTPETETSSPDIGSNGGDGSDVTIAHVSDTSESSARNGGRGRGQGGCTIGGGHQGRDRQGGRFNRPSYTSPTRNIKVEVENFGAVIRTLTEQRKANNQYNKFNEKMKQYVLR